MNAHPATYPVLNPVREPATSQPAEQHFPSVDQTQAAAAAAAAAVAIPPELLAASNLTSWHNAALQWQQQAPLLAAAGHLPQDANTTALLSHFAQQLGGIPAINQMATAQHLAAQPVASASADAGALAGGMEAAQKTPGLGSESAQDEREMEGIKNRLTRRLEQNRASARRARERKKGYVSDLERQLEQMVNQKQMLEQTLASVNEINERNAAAAAAESNAAQAVAGAEMSMYQQQQQQAQREDAVAGTAPSSSPAQSQWPEGVEFDLFKDDGSPAAAATALKTWRYQFSQVSFQLKSVQANESATVQEVEAAVASAKSSVSRLMMVRSKVISRGHVLAVLSGDGFLASERPFLWLGFLRPTTVIARILEKVPSLLGPTTLALRRLHELHLRHEAAIEKALDAALHDLKVILTQEITLRVPGHDGQVAPILNSIPCQASALGSVDTIGVMLKQLQGMWTHILEVVSKELGLQQQLVAYGCMVDLLADLRSYPDLLKP